MRRKIVIAQMLIAETGAAKYIKEDEEGYYYKCKGKMVRIRPGGSVAIKTKDDWETLEVGVPQDIVDLQDVDMKGFRQSLAGWLTDSRAFAEETSN